MGLWLAPATGLATRPSGRPYSVTRIKLLKPSLTNDFRGNALRVSSCTFNFEHINGLDRP